MKFKWHEKVKIKGMEDSPMTYRIKCPLYRMWSEDYIVKNETLGIEHEVNVSELIKIEDMKKKANLTLETAKEFYKQGGAARNFALDNYSKDELTQPDWPESWQGLGHIEGYYVGKNSSPIFRRGYTITENKFVAPTKEDCESMLAYAQLRQLAEEMNNGWEPDDREDMYIVYVDEFGVLRNGFSRYVRSLIPFKSPKMAEFSLTNHRELWEKYYKL